MPVSTGRPLEGLSVLLGDDNVATRASGWWLENLGATVTSDPSGIADVAVVRAHDGEAPPTLAATTTIVVSSPPTDADAVGEAARLWLRSGLGSLTRTVAEEGGQRPPCLPTVPLVQGLGAMLVALMVAAYAARAHREDGPWTAPRLIEIDLLELLCLLPSQFVAMAQVPSRRIPGVVGAVGWRIGGVIETSDGAVCAQAPEPGQWARLLQVLPGAEAIASDITDPAELRDHAGEVDRLLREWAASHTKQEVSDLAQQMRVPVTPLLRPEELPANPHYAARRFFTSTSPRRTRVPWLTRTGAVEPPEDRTQPDDRGPRTDRPLSGFRILDLTWAWAGPFATTLLAELGAEIINLEWTPRPSNLRVQQPLVEGFGFDGSAWWSATQRGKSSVGINFKHEDGRRLVVDLARHCDAVIDNFAPGVVDRLGIGFDDLVAANPDLVYVSMSAFGASGPSSHFVGYGTHLYASAGLSYVITSATGGPSEMPIPLPDPISGIAGAIAVAAHLAAARGVHVDVSDLEATCLSRLEGMVDGGDDLRYDMSGDPNGWRVRFGDGSEEPVLSIGEMLQDDRLHRRDFWLVDEHEALRDRHVRYGRAPWLLDGERTPALTAAPNLFSGTRDALVRILGLTDAQVEELAAAGAIHLPEARESSDRTRRGNRAVDITS